MELVNEVLKNRKFSEAFAKFHESDYSACLSVSPSVWEVLGSRRTDFQEIRPIHWEFY
jgi:hypothetical protein